MIRRKLVALALALGAVACSGKDSTTSEAFQGTIAGERFVPVEATGFLMGPLSCANPEFAGWNMVMVQVQFWSFAGACDLASSTAFCGTKANGRVASVAVTHANVNGGPVPAIEPGTYTFEGTHVVDPNGVVRFLWTGIGATDAACLGATEGMPKDAIAASITLEEIGPTRLRGHAELSFDNGDVLAGSFDAPVCTSSDDAQCLAMKGGCALDAISCTP
jgi:hypothetical protein